MDFKDLVELITGAIKDFCVNNGRDHAVVLIKQELMVSVKESSGHIRNYRISIMEVV